MPDVHLTKKLLLKPDHTIRLINAPPAYADLIALSDQPTTAKPDCIVLFAHSQAELAAHTQTAIEALQPTSLFWIAYRKKTSGIKSDLHRDADWSVVTACGYENVSLIAIDNIWSAMRFRMISESNSPRRRSEPSPPRDARPELIVPPDLAILLDESPAAKTTLDRFSYSGRKEYIQWIEGAKRPETRAKRLQKAIEMLSEGKALS